VCDEEGQMAENVCIGGNTYIDDTRGKTAIYSWRAAASIIEEQDFRARPFLFC
jgi:hypothetical protein